MPSKVLSPVNLQNRFSGLMFTDESSIESESQTQTPTNYHQCVEIQNIFKDLPQRSLFIETIKTLIGLHSKEG